ncbi:MAG: hypothetical protein HXX18_00175 [Bacteroidetes bacterium]|nr:hypothetical protein [Bacteroidota bacterium]
MRLLKALTVIALLIVNFSAFAQQTEKNGKTPEEKAKQHLKAINKECSLTNDQSIKVEQVLLNTQTKLEALKSSKPTQKGEKIKELKAINDNQTTEISKILNPEQYVKYQALVEKQKEKIRNRLIERQNKNVDLAK